MPATNYCECGCGEAVTERGRAGYFVTGHANRLRSRLLGRFRRGDAVAVQQFQLRGWTDVVETPATTSQIDPIAAPAPAPAPSPVAAPRQNPFARPAARPSVRPVASTPATAATVVGSLTNRKFGVEIEFARSSSTDTVVREMQTRGLECAYEGYNHETRRHWKIVTDGSCGYELVSPPLQGANGADQIRKACAALQAAGAEVNRQCGLHVHLECNDLQVADVQRLCALYHGSREAINSIQYPSRRSNSYSAHHTNDELAAINAMRNMEAVRRCGLNRYRAVNLCSYARYGTIEFRQHGGTMVATKMLNWVALIQAMVESAKEARSVRTTLAGMLADLRVGTDVQQYFLERAVELGGAA